MNNLLKGLHVFQPKLFTDERGFFYESFNQEVFQKKIGSTVNFVQDNVSLSKKNVLRGLHLQQSPSEQGKLVKVVKGEIFDIAVDLRKGSDTFGHYSHIVLSEYNRKQFWIPPGFAHGFYTLSESAEVHYKVTNYYSPDSEITIKWNDTDLNIKWPFSKLLHPIVSAKDDLGITLEDYRLL